VKYFILGYSRFFFFGAEVLVDHDLNRSLGEVVRLFEGEAAGEEVMVIGDI
jgi:hypothetical protein